MKDKNKDWAYCNVNRIKIKNAHPKLSKTNFNHFLDFIDERFRIHVKKDLMHQPFPWTENPVLLSYKFTNVFREDDKTTRALLEIVTNNPNLSLEDKIVNTFLFRAWNNPETFKDFRLPASALHLYKPSFKETIRPIYKRLSEESPERMWWSSAYNQGGTKHAWKFPDGDGYQRAYKESEAKKYPDWEADIPLRPFHVAVWLKRQGIVEKLLNSRNQKECFDIIRSVRGFADFLAYQVFVDLTYIPEFPFSENEFVVAGPGCQKGIDLVFKDRDGLSYEESLFWLRDFMKEDNRFIQLRAYLALYEKEINVMSLENCMCEISKYIRTVSGKGRPRCHYKPKEE